MQFIIQGQGGKHSQLAFCKLKRKPAPPTIPTRHIIEDADTGGRARMHSWGLIGWGLTTPCAAQHCSAAVLGAYALMAAVMHHDMRPAADARLIEASSNIRTLSDAGGQQQRTAEDTSDERLLQPVAAAGGY
jgi:hypothetical protein